MELSCRLGQFGDYRVKRHVVLSHGDVKAENTEEKPDTVVPAETFGMSAAGVFIRPAVPEKKEEVFGDCIKD